MTANIQILVPAICYCLLFSLCYGIRKKKSDTLLSEKVVKGNRTFLYIRNVGGMLIMVLCTLILLPVLPMELLSLPQDIDYSKIITLYITSVFIMTLSLTELKKINITINYSGYWSYRNAILYLITRIIFLVSYEWFFRVIILFSCIAVFGILPAICINVVLYAFIHSFSAKKEFMGSIPLGVILCVFTIWWHSVWPAILLHLILSLTYEFSILKRLFQKRSKLIL